MATGHSLKNYLSYFDDEADAKTLAGVARWLFHNNMIFAPVGYFGRVVVREAFPGVILNVTIDEPVMQGLHVIAKEMGRTLDTVVNDLLSRGIGGFDTRGHGGYRFYHNIGFSPDEIGVTKGIVNLTVPIEQPAIIAVSTDNKSNNHALYWDGAMLWDPARQAHDNPVDFNDYNILSWQSITVMDGASTTVPQLYLDG
jgi:hypothetical protein